MKNIKFYCMVIVCVLLIGCGKESADATRTTNDIVNNGIIDVAASVKEGDERRDVINKLGEPTHSETSDTNGAGRTIIDVYDIEGLEFDYVFIYDDNYHQAKIIGIEKSYPAPAK